MHTRMHVYVNTYRCPSSLDQISFTTKELGTVTLDLGSMADSNWMSSQGCYGTLRCVQGPCQGVLCCSVLQRVAMCGNAA